MMKRIFAAIKIHPGPRILEILDILQKDLSDEKINWVKPENMHLTLKFFGDTPDKNIQQIITALNSPTLLVNPFDITLKGLGSFGSSRFPRVIWLGIETNPGLSTLYDAINNALKPLGHKPDKPFFTPHLTLGRIRDIKTPDQLYGLESEFNDEEFQKCTIEKFTLYQSILSPKGSLYKPLHEFKLKNQSTL
jgi:RNA 2',3'-cyclic 3'-phosphodiesterase